MKIILFALLLTISFSLVLNAAEVKNDSVRQEGNRLIVTYDLEGTDTEANVVIMIIVGGKTYAAGQLHLEGDFGMVRKGKGKKVWWNVLQDFPAGLTCDVEVSVTAGGGVYRDQAAGIEFAWVPGGCFQMGCGSWQRDCDDSEKPVHEVCLNGFWMSRTEVTQGQWKYIMGNNPSEFKKGADYPVEMVNWDDVQDFIKEFNKQSGKKYRLPTEAEWEYAASFGSKEEYYAGGNDIDELGWYENNATGIFIADSTRAVATKRPNELGLFDMSGNVWEWCQDWYEKDYYKNSSRSNPIGPASGSTRVIRGGSWYGSPWYVRTAVRLGRNPDRRFNSLGFRLVLPSTY